MKVLLLPQAFLILLLATSTRSSTPPRNPQHFASLIFLAMDAENQLLDFGVEEPGNDVRGLKDKGTIYTEVRWTRALECVHG